MAALMDRGDSYRVAYLGSAQLKQMATGLGILQQPLRELYIKARKPGSSNLTQRQLTITGEGMRMSYKNKANGPLEEEFYAIPYLLLWDAVRFVSVQSQDKKDKRPRCAFEPLDNDHSRNKVNLFSPLDKKYKFLQQQQHGAIFTCVLRRTKGIKMLDLHAFMCSSDEEALGIVRALNAVHASHTDEQNTETGVFSYSPFGKSTVRVPAGADLSAAHFAKTPPVARRVANQQQHHSDAAHRSVTSRGGGSALMAAAQLSHPHHNSAKVAGGAAGSAGYNHHHRGTGDQSSHFTVAAASGAAVSNRQQTPHVKNVFASPHQPALISDLSAHHSNQLARQTRVFHLSQEDLVTPQSQLQIAPGFDDFDIDSGYNSQQPHNNKGGADEDIYDYTGSITRHKNVQEQYGRDGRGESQAVKLRQRSSGQSDARHSNRHSVHETHNLNELQEFQFRNQQRSKSGLVLDQPPSAANLGQGYSLLGPNNGQVDAISMHSHSFDHQRSNQQYPQDRPHTVSPGQSRQLFRDLQEFQSRQEQHDPTPNRGLFMRPPKSPGYLDKPPNMGGHSQQQEGERIRNPHASHLEQDHSAEQVPERPELPRGGDVTPPPPPRQKPIARVPPHMKTGVRVLPDNFSIPPPRSTNSTDERQQSKSKSDRPKSGLFSSPKSTVEKSDAKSKSGLFQKHNTSTGDRPKSGLFMKSPTGSLPEKTNGSNQQIPGDFVNPKTDKTDNWQFGGKRKDNAHNVNNPSVDRKTGEKLLMSKKKDAEIASVMQNLRLDYRDTPTLTPGAPSGMNFEKSLGYFP